MKRTNHYNNERKERERVIREEIGYGKIIKTFLIDRGHKDGPELHKITDTGLILIYNAYTKRLVTKLIARPGQLKRYDWYVSQELLDIAYYNTVIKHFNEC